MEVGTGNDPSDVSVDQLKKWAINVMGYSGAQHELDQVSLFYSRLSKTPKSWILRVVKEKYFRKTETPFEHEKQ